MIYKTEKYLLKKIIKKSKQTQKQFFLSLPIDSLAFGYEKVAIVRKIFINFDNVNFILFFITFRKKYKQK